MSSNEWGIILATIGVVVGVILEGWEHWDEYKKKGWKPIVPKIGFAILVISLAIEIVFDARLAQESANTELKAAQLQEALAWRSLTPLQQHQIAAALKLYAGQKINCLVYFSDLEAWVFADKIEVALGYKHLAAWTAGWDVHFGQIVLSPRVTSGLLIETSPKASDQDRAAANALAKILRTITMGVIGPWPRDERMKGETASGDMDSQANITLTVGVHPPPSAELER
jgi:hypothetical protein